MTEVCHQPIPVFRTLVQEVMDCIKTTAATARIKQGTQHLDIVQQAGEKEPREGLLPSLESQKLQMSPSPPRERSSVDRGTVLDIFDTINSDSVPQQILRM